MRMDRVVRTLGPCNTVTMKLQRPKANGGGGFRQHSALLDSRGVTIGDDIDEGSGEEQQQEDSGGQEQESVTENSSSTAVKNQWKESVHAVQFANRVQRGSAGRNNSRGRGGLKRSSLESNRGIIDSASTAPAPASAPAPPPAPLELHVRANSRTGLVGGVDVEEAEWDDVTQVVGQEEGNDRDEDKTQWHCELLDFKALLGHGGIPFIKHGRRGRPRKKALRLVQTGKVGGAWSTVSQSLSGATLTQLTSVDQAATVPVHRK